MDIETVTLNKESWKKYFDNNGCSAAVLIDLSKAFDTIDHDLLLGKLYTYDDGGYSLTKVNGEFSNWEELLTGVP